MTIQDEPGLPDPQETSATAAAVPVSDEPRRRPWRAIKAIFAIGVGLFVLALALAWGGRALGLWGPGAHRALPTSLPIGSWRAYSPPDGRFSVEFPGDPRVGTGQEQGIQTTAATATTAEGEFFVGWVDLGLTEVRPDYGPAMARSMSARRSATILTEKAVTVSGRPGYHFVLAVPSECAPSIPGPCRLTWLALPVGSRLYSIGTAVPEPPGVNTSADRFLASLTLRP